ncbi:uncharacterized protein LOC126907272 isoform X3 [Daktulosphaira vitifoliae]|uniref:uncharacterized protein LOC126907272 isoform X3 n=1 Tax=Daktulosphaira vitifoliae TaxID=58002 RepID=UPI0021A9814A|nr:uncharacterized protein LOC126907272 isoform X3 [Daktulosphaira vitifoliae]
MHLSIFIFLYFTHLGDTKIISPKSVKDRYLEYVITVIQHICDQKGWNSMQHLQLNHDVYGNMTIKDAISQKVYKYDVLDKFIIVVHLLNYKYIEILKNYAKLVIVSIKECKKYSTHNLYREFIDCTQRIEHGVKNSMIMFDNLYQVMTFMSYFDTKCVFKNFKGIPFVIVEEIYFAFHNTSTMKISDQSFFIDQNGNFISENAISVLKSIKNFIDQLNVMVENIKVKKLILAEIPKRVNYYWIFEEQYLHYQSKNSNLTSIDIVLLMLESFCENTIKNDYEDLGFKEILNPHLYKCDSLFVPQFIDPDSQEKGIVNLNILLNEGNWNTLSYLYINHNGQDISLSRVLRDQANNNNFHLKKQYITQLLKCRFYDILKNFTTYLSGVLDLSKKQKNNSDKLKDLNCYIECVNNFFLIMKSVQDLLNYLNTAMEKLKQASIWHENGAFYCLSPIKKIIDNILEVMKEKNLLRDDFSDCILNLEEVANNYIADVHDVKCFIQLEFRHVRGVHESHCFYHEKVLFTKQYVFNISKKKTISTNIAHSSTNPISNCQQACTELYLFCENFIGNEYKNLGFDKIN